MTIFIKRKIEQIKVKSIQKTLNNELNQKYDKINDETVTKQNKYAVTSDKLAINLTGTKGHKLCITIRESATYTKK